MIARLDGPVRFGVFELDRHTGELRKAGARINLPEQPFQVLEALLDRPGDLVTREELRQRLWPAETFVDFDQGLNAAVRRLRDALGDSADTPRFVETLPRRGYRFIAPVTAPSVPEASVPPHPVIEDGQDAPRAPDGRGAHWRLTGAWTSVLVAAIARVSSFSLDSWISAPAPRAFSTERAVRTIHAGGTAVREPDRKPGPGIHRRRDDRRTDRTAEQDESVASRGHRTDVRHAVQENHQTGRRHWFGARRDLSDRRERSHRRKPHPDRRAADRSEE